MLSFYDVDQNYVAFLRKTDKKVPNIQYNSNNKFVCGIVLSINGINYYAPVSHFNKKQQTNFLIYNKDNLPIASVRFSFMFPAKPKVLTKKNFNQIAKINKPYADLLSTEWSYCSAHINVLKAKAMSVYKIGCNKQHILNYTCCDFLKLEKIYANY